MKKLYLILFLIVSLFLGSLFTVLSSNMLFNDIMNIAAGSSTILVTLPSLMFSVIFILIILYIIRTYKHPEYKKAITKLYLIISSALGGIGFITAILAGVLVYHNLASKQPFPGYLIIFMILNLLVFGASIIGLFLYVKKMPEDQGKMKMKVTYVLKTIGWFLFIALTFNRFGLLLGAPVYIYLRNLYKTFPFYLYLLMPVFLGVLEVMTIFGILDKKKLNILTFVSFGLNVVFFAYIAIMGINDTAFISSLSQIMPLERMGSMPMEILIHFLSYIGVGVALLLQNRKPKEEVKE